MTPEEKAVIEAAMELYHEGQNDHWTACAVVVAVERMLKTQELAPEWVPATLVQCLAGDHIRIGTEETDVLRSSSGIWHADNSDAWQPKKWNHLELRMELAANPKQPGVEKSGFCEYPPNLPCEILCTPERKAVLLLQTQFPGSAVTSSDVD